MLTHDPDLISKVYVLYAITLVSWERIIGERKWMTKAGTLKAVV
jgi:hypothetical protein